MTSRNEAHGFISAFETDFLLFLFQNRHHCSDAVASVCCRWPEARWLRWSDAADGAQVAWLSLVRAERAARTYARCEEVRRKARKEQELRVLCVECVRIKEHIADASKPPLLIFPEGTCVNNDYCVMFKKGVRFSLFILLHPFDNLSFFFARRRLRSKAHRCFLSPSNTSRGKKRLPHNKKVFFFLLLLLQ